MGRAEFPQRSNLAEHILSAESLRLLKHLRSVDYAFSPYLGAGMQQLVDWLKYAQLFAENGIELSVLPDLTDQDLEKLGVVVGHRRKMLRDHRFGSSVEIEVHRSLERFPGRGFRTTEELHADPFS
jgi:hypothetical protein